jgi:hypothetical protein
MNIEVQNKHILPPNSVGEEIDYYPSTFLILLFTTFDNTMSDI